MNFALRISRFVFGLFVTAIAAAALSGKGQTFINLDFEHPNLPLTPDQNFQVPISSALPGWIGYVDGSVTSEVLYNTVSVGSADISLQGPGSTGPILQGSYSVELQPSLNGAATAAIAQTGLIPSSSLSFTFLVQPGSQFQVTVAGQNIPLVEYESAANYDVLGGNISMFAGQTEELRFTGGGILDNIQFLASPVPEPATCALILAGAVLLRAKWQRKGQ